MEALNILKFWRKAVRVDIDYVTSGFANQTPETQDYYSDDDSFFELELNSAKLVESSTHVFRNGRVFPLDSNNSKPQSPVSILKSAPKFKLFVVGFKKSKSKPESDGNEITAVLSGDNSLRSKLVRDDSGTKKSDVAKYLKVLKPLYSMASKRYNNGDSPARKTSGKSNKSGVATTTPSPVNRRDDCLLHDGIQAAILHCNRSFNSPSTSTR